MINNDIFVGEKPRKKKLVGEKILINVIHAYRTLIKFVHI